MEGLGVGRADILCLMVGPIEFALGFARQGSGNGTLDNRLLFPSEVALCSDGRRRLKAIDEDMLPWLPQRSNW
jgi:hypothetical protein